MGQVIDKTVQILKLVASEEHQTLKTLCEAVGSKKPAMCLTLQSLVANGVLQKNSCGEYQIGPLLYELTAPRSRESRILEAADAVGSELNNGCGETVTVATIRNGKYRRLVQCSCQLAVRIAAAAPDEEHFYGNATGRILLAYAPPEVRREIIGRLGLPSKEEWQEASGSEDALQAALASIRRQKYAERRCHNGEVLFIAVGMINPADGTPFAIGINAPMYRSNKNKLLELLTQAAERLSKAIK